MACARVRACVWVGWVAPWYQALAASLQHSSLAAGTGVVTLTKWTSCASPHRCIMIRTVAVTEIHLSLPPMHLRFLI
jgi:hypothetical protein